MAVNRALLHLEDLIDRVTVDGRLQTVDLLCGAAKLPLELGRLDVTIRLVDVVIETVVQLRLDHLSVVALLDGGSLALDNYYQQLTGTAMWTFL